MPLATCPECSRHVKVTESQCPFCESALPEDLAGHAQHRPPHPGRFGRAALVTFGAALTTVSSLACSSGSGGGVRQPVYGAPVDFDAGDASATNPVDDDDMVDQPVYGLPADSND